MTSLLLLLGPMLAAAAPAEKTDPRLQAYLEQCDRNYSDEQQMLGQKLTSPGYHTTIANGTWTHSTRGSLGYAAALLQRGRPDDCQCAAKIIRKTLSLQDTDPKSRTYGIWPWLLEEPLAEMSPPDWNWADFCGSQIAQMLVDEAAKLPDDLRPAMCASLGHAARAIRKRNVGPDYTNIAIMGGGVCAAAGEILGEPELLAYGRERLQKVVQHAAQHGSFTEYNSPTYTMVALYECERTLHLVRDPATREAAESLRRTAWQIIADSYSPGTRQWAGPHSRSYSDYLSRGLLAYLAEQTGVPVRPPAKDDAGRGGYEVRHSLPCPADLRERFRTLPADPLELRRTFVRGKTPAESVVGTTWHTANACLGSASRASFWTQQRPLIGYWQTDDERPAVLRLRFLHEDRDFASMGVRTAQQGGRALAVCFPLKNQGDWHPGLDRPADGVFPAADFRLRCELRGRGAKAAALESGGFVLTAGNRRAVVHALPGRFAGQPIAWQIGQDGESAFVDGVCYRGEKKGFKFREPLEVVLALGIELLRADEPPAGKVPALVEDKPGAVEAVWELGGDCRLSVRREP